MLLPSAFCDTPPKTSKTAAPRSRLFSPPCSPPSLATSRLGSNIITTCRSLQSLITAPSPTTSTSLTVVTSFPTHRQLPTPPMAHAPPPMKLRLRTPGSEQGIAARRLVKRAEAGIAALSPTSPPRGANKRRREEEDEQKEEDTEMEMPTTPKRARIAPEQMPMGLDRSDFHAVHLQSSPVNEEHGDDNYTLVPPTEDAAEDDWTAEDDRVLVELVLEKLKLTKSEWAECARSLGKKDKNGVSRRWKSLMAAGDVGVKSRRAKICSTWR